MSDLLPQECPYYQGTGKCNGAAGSCGAAGEPLCQTNEPEGGWDGRLNRSARVPLRTLLRWVHLVRDATKAVDLGAEKRRSAMLSDLMRFYRAPVEVGHFEVYGDTVATMLDGCTCSPHYGAHERGCGEEPAFGTEDIVTALRRAGWTCTPPEPT